VKDNKYSRKESLERYKEREVTGGLYAIRNTANNKLLLGVSADLRGSGNRFEFSRQTGSCVEIKLQSDWDKYGGAGFVFEVLEELKRGDTQTTKEFKEDLDLLKALWLEKLADGDFY